MSQQPPVGTPSNAAGTGSNMTVYSTGGFIKQTEDSDIDRTPEYVSFLQDLKDYHKKRGTHLQNNGEPALGPRRLDLLKLYKKILGRGGYDAVSDQGMAWRGIADEYNIPPMSNAGMPGYLLKTIYYKCLAAYEIEKHWGKKPPVPELLEHMTARGGAIMRRPEVRDPAIAARMLAQRKEQPPKPPRTPASREPKSTPKVPKSVPDANRGGYQTSTPANRTMMPYGGGSYPSGYPPATNHMPPPYQHAYAMNVNLNAPSTGFPYGQPLPAAAAVYTRKKSTAVAGQFDTYTLKPNSQKFLDPTPVVLPDATGEADVLETRITKPVLGRVMLALKSGIDSEVDWAMGLLLKGTYELVDEIQLEQTQGLAETLLIRIDQGINMLLAQQRLILTESASENGVELGPAAKRQRRDNSYFNKSGGTEVESRLDAALVLRNLVLNADNARYLSRLSFTSEVLCRGLSLDSCVSDKALEMRSYCLELCDAAGQYLVVAIEDDPLYKILVAMLGSDDRAEILCSTRVLSRVALNDEQNYLLQDVRLETIIRLALLADTTDAELAAGICDFLFQWTSYLRNTKALSRHGEVRTFISQLLGLIDSGSEPRAERRPIQKSVNRVAPAERPGEMKPTGPPDLPQDIIDELLQYSEPERAIHWLRCSFEEVNNDDVTQLQLWRSYQARFMPYTTTGPPAMPGGPPGRPLLQAADLIKIVSQAFASAQAMVMQGPEGQRFIIRNIRFRSSPVSIGGRRNYHTCRWIVDEAQRSTCSAFFSTPGDLFAHVCRKHVDAAPVAAAAAAVAGVDAGQTKMRCGWAGCGRFTTPHEVDRKQLKQHLLIHMPDQETSIESSSLPQSQTQQQPQQQQTSSETYLEILRRPTPRDDKGEARGTALAAVLIIRNLLRAAEDQASIREALLRPASGLEHVWGRIESILLEALTVDYSLAGQLCRLVSTIQNVIDPQIDAVDDVA